MNLHRILIGSQDSQRLPGCHLRLSGEPGRPGGDVRGWPPGSPFPG